MRWIDQIKWPFFYPPGKGCSRVHRRSPPDPACVDFLREEKKVYLLTLHRVWTLSSRIGFADAFLDFRDCSREGLLP
jgi:hypothetical protein